MLIGELLAVSGKGDTFTAKALTPWIATWGNTAVFSFEIIDIWGPSASVSVKVFTKTTESADPGTQVGTTNTQSVAGTYSVTDANNLLELVRLEFSISMTSSSSSFETAVARVRPLNPAWKTN